MKIKFLIISLFIISASYSQDHIYTTGNDTIEAKILEVSKHQVSFKDLSSSSADVLSLRKHQIWKINYADGKEEIFNDHSVWSETFHAVTDAIVDISKITWQAMLDAEHFMEDKYDEMKASRDAKKTAEAEAAEKARIASIENAEAKRLEEEAFKKKQEEDARARAEEAARMKAEEEAKRKAEAEAARKAEEERKRILEEERKKDALAKELSLEEQKKKQAELEQLEDKKEAVVKEEVVALPPKKEKRQDYEHHSDDHAETAGMHSAHADMNVASGFHQSADKFVHHNTSKKDGLGPMVSNFRGRTDSYSVPLKETGTPLRASHKKVIDEFFYTDSEIDRYLSPTVIDNYNAHYVTSSDLGLDTLSDTEVAHLADWSRFAKNKQQAFNEFKKKNPNSAGDVYIPNLTYLDLSYSYKLNRVRKKYKSDGSVYYYVDYDVWVYIRNTSKNSYTYNEHSPIARMNFKNNAATGEWFRMRPSKVGENKWMIKAGEVISKRHTVSVKQNSPSASNGGPIMKEWEVTFASPVFDLRGLSERESEVIQKKTLKAGYLTSANRCYNALDNEVPLVRDYYWRNHKGVGEMSEDGKSSLYLYYSFNKFTNSFKDAGSRAIDDMPMHMEIYINGNYVGPIKKGEVVRILLEKGGDYNVFIQERKGKEKNEPYTAKNVAVKDGETHYLRVRRISDPKSRPQLYHMSPEMGREEIEDTYRCFQNWKVTGFTYR